MVAQSTCPRQSLNTVSSVSSQRTAGVQPNSRAARAASPADALHIRRTKPDRLDLHRHRHAAPRDQRIEDVADTARHAGGDVVGAARHARRLQSRDISRADIPHIEKIPPAVKRAHLHHRRLPARLDPRDLAGEARHHETLRLARVRSG